MADMLICTIRQFGLQLARTAILEMGLGGAERFRSVHKELLNQGLQPTPQIPRGWQGLRPAMIRTRPTISDAAPSGRLPQILLNTCLRH